MMLTTDQQQDRAAKDPSTPSAAHTTMSPRWKKMQTLLDGTDAMREAGRLYLPSHPEESHLAYNERLAATTLFNLTGLTLKSWVGRPFSDKVDIEDDVPAEIADLLNTDVDLQGNNIDVFARRWFEKGLGKAICHVLVEFPRKLDPGDGAVRTLADDRKDKLRPYWVLVEPESVLSAHATVINGIEVLDHVRIREYATEMDGFAEITTEQIRVLTPGHVAIWKEKKVKNQTAWVLDDQWDTDVKFIPLVTFYADREAFMVGKPPLLDLADLNISHWQSSSDQRAVLTVARFPILACSGGTTDQQQLVVGPNKWLVTPNEHGKFYYVEHTGKAIAAGRQDLADLEAQMSNYGAEFLRKQPNNLTATARTLDSAESTSPLMDVTIRFLDAMATALSYTAHWMGLECGGTVKLPTDFGPEEAQTADYQALIAARKNKDISRKTFNAELLRRGTLGDDFDPEANDTELENEAGDMSGSPFGDMNMDPDAGDEKDPTDAE